MQRLLALLEVARGHADLGRAGLGRAHAGRRAPALDVDRQSRVGCPCRFRRASRRRAGRRSSRRPSGSTPVSPARRHEGLTSNNTTKTTGKRLPVPRIPLAGRLSGVMIMTRGGMLASRPDDVKERAGAGGVRAGRSRLTAWRGVRDHSQRMDHQLTIYWTILGVCLLLSAFFSSSETALMSIGKVRVRQLKERHARLGQPRRVPAREPRPADQHDPDRQQHREHGGVVGRDRHRDRAGPGAPGSRGDLRRHRPAAGLRGGHAQGHRHGEARHGLAAGRPAADADLPGARAVRRDLQRAAAPDHVPARRRGRRGRRRPRRTSRRSRCSAARRGSSARTSRR